MIQMPWIASIQKLLLAAPLLGFSAAASELAAAAHYRKEIAPILNEFCSDCHADGARKGNVAFDEFKSDADILAHKELWLNSLKNLRAGLMPPPKKPKPTAEQIRTLEAWIKADAFGIDPANPDPGRVTIRRLNRNEYRNTIRDLTGYDYKVEEELPPDDTGYGFDNIGDVLTVSPLLMEKYMQAAEQITAATVPRVSLKVDEKTIIETKPRSGGGGRMSFYEAGKSHHKFTPKAPGTYKVYLDLEVFGQFDFDPGATRVTFKIDGNEVLAREFKWQSHQLYNFDYELKWDDTKEKALQVDLAPLTPVAQKKNSLEMRVAGLRVEGPLEKEHWSRPKNFERFFTKDPPTEPKARREYARETLQRFAEKAYRRPVDARTLDRLTDLAESIYTQPGKVFEDGIAETMTPILASTRFLFRIEDTEPSLDTKNHPLIDEYALAARLSYFLWSTMPDAELTRLASKRELRKNLDAQVQRLLADSRADAFVQNFVGQWLQVRDVEGIDINVSQIISRDGNGVDPEFKTQQARFRELRDIAEDKLTDEQKEEIKKLRAAFNERRKNAFTELDGGLRRALREETEKKFSYIARGDRNLLELIDADYTFLNDRLAKLYGITNVSGGDMRLVKLEPGSPRGGVLTDGSTLIVTSNPTRTSPVKRGLFVLDNILGMPPPPPPPDIPALEESEKEFHGKQPTLRETLELHRNKPLCASCHSRMDPLGFALENFNAVGMWRDKERGQTIDASGSLTGDEFKDIRDVKKVLTTKYRDDFYRCLTEKMLIYALGRGLQYYDVDSVDRIVERIGKEDGKFSALLTGIVESAPFQKRRNPEAKENLPPGKNDLPSAKPAETRASIDAP
jgi:mono/diheme cytochrome c family protein